MIKSTIIEIIWFEVLFIIIAIQLLLKQ